ncbi:hypothetical protein GCM10027020_37000 [Nocardioides salsibiostraticola]
MQPAVLVVGQSLSRLEATRDALDQGGLTNPVVSVRDAPMARAYIRGHAPYDNRSAYPLPAVVVTDLTLADGSGLDVLRSVRSHLSLRRTPVVVVSDGASAAEISEAQLQGATAVLSHHVAADVLLGVIRDAGVPWSVSRMEAPG